MFILVTISDTIYLHPEQLKHHHYKAVVIYLNKKYSGKVLLDHGYCICVYDIIKFKEALIEDGKILQDVTFRLCTFKPKIGEILIGTVKSHDVKKGLTISLEFFSNIYIPPENLHDNSTFLNEKNMWFWNYGKNSRPYLPDKKIRFQVTQIYYNSIFDKEPEPMNQELIELQMMNPNERHLHVLEIKNKRLKRMKKEIESMLDQTPEMYIIANLKTDDNELGLIEWFED